MDLGTSQLTGFSSMQPLMPLQGPGTAPWWGFMNPAGGGGGGGFPLIPPHYPPTGNLNFPIPAMPAMPMFNPTIPMFSPFTRQRNVARYAEVAEAEPAEAPDPPTATAEYLAQASQAASPTQTAQPLLVILDLNGTLIHGRNRKFPPKFTRRSLLDKFLATLLLKHKVMVWSSSQPKTVKAICQQLFSPMQRKALLAEWGRDKLNLTSSQYKSKVQVYKTLETVWKDQAVQSRYPKSILENETDSGNVKSRWDQSNTVLLDDSKLKALSEPFNIIELPEYEGFETPGQDGETIFPKVLSRLEMLSRHDDVSKVLRGWSRTDTAMGTATGPGKEFLDFELDELDRLHIFSVSDNHPTPTSPGPKLEQSHSTKEDAQIQKRLLRKAMKNERKAAKEARDLKSVYNNPNSPLYRGSGTPDTGSEQGGDSTQHDDDDSLDSKERKKQKHKHRRAENRRERSSSGSGSGPSQSENQLLDRLEESLTV